MKFSIITPSFNQVEWLRLCAASIADQEGVCVEHIIQDAGTPGLTRERIAGGEAVPGSRATVSLIVEKDRGMYDAINRGLRRASGDILAYLNCDEQYLPGALAEVQRFFDRHPEVDVLFGDAVIVGSGGEYLCTRKISLPRLYHTWVCTLSIFTAATFFRRRIIDEEKVFFSDEWRAVGDAVWVLDLLRRSVRMARLGAVTSASTETGENLILDPNSRKEQEALRRSAPRWVRCLSPIWMLGHRMRRLLAGNYRPEPMTYSIFTRESPIRRRAFDVEKPTFALAGRFGSAARPTG